MEELDVSTLFLAHEIAEFGLNPEVNVGLWERLLSYV